MRVVDRPMARPMHCAAIPFIAQTTPNVRWIDTGNTLPSFDNHIYISDVAVRQMAEHLGMPSVQSFAEARGLLKQAEERIAALTAENAELTERNEYLERFRGSIDFIESEGYTSRKKTGRPSKAAA